MIKSMTGYGSAEYQLEGKTVKIEIRSLNSKGLDINIRIPSSFNELEQIIRKKLSSEITRGKINVVITREITGAEHIPRINNEIVASYIEQMEEAARISGIDQPERNELFRIALTLPESLTSKDHSGTEKEQRTLIESIEKAIAGLNDFRRQEGIAMEKEVESRTQNILKYLGTIEQHENSRIETVRKRIIQNMKGTVNEGDIDMNRFQQEIIYYLEKMDISEEKSRLENHCTYLRDIMKKEDAPGKKMLFVIQEMGREINTLGSKAGDFNIQKLVVQMKDELEKIREQTMNIE